MVLNKVVHSDISLHPHTNFKVISKPHGIHSLGYLFGHFFDEACYLLLRVRFVTYLMLLVSGFLIFNTVFAALVVIDPNGLSGGDGSFREAFFFSVQTFSTIGFGRLSPISPWTDTVVVVEAMLSLILISVAGGLSFARVVRPRSRLTFAQRGVIQSLNGVPMLRFRVCNERARNSIFNAHFTLTASYDRVDKERTSVRIQRDCKLEQDTVPVFGATFTVCHLIDENSPLYGITASNASRYHTVDLLVGGTDETYMSQIYAHHVYRPSKDFAFGEWFTNIIDAEKGTMDLSRMHDTTSVPDEASR